MATIVTRAGKGSALTWVEADANFNNLNSELGTAVQNTRQVATGAGLTGGGTLAANRTLSILDATAAEMRTHAGANAIIPTNITEALALVTLSDAASVVVTWTSFIVSQVTLTANRALANPTATVVGSTRYVFVKGNSATARTLTFGANYKGDLPVLNDITSTKWYLLTLICYSSTHIVVAAVQAL